MPLNLNKLSALAVTKTSKPGYYGDGGGLWLQVARSGSKSWIFRFKMAGRQREMGLGGLRTVDLAKARVLARECRSLLLEGKDPIEARKAARLADALQRARSMTFDQCAAAYIDAHRKAWKNAKHAEQWKNTLATYASPIIGALPVADVDTDLLVKVLSPIWGTKTETATRVRGRIESILDWATVSQFRQGDNPARWRGHLENLLANPSKIAPVKNHPALPWREMPAFMVRLGQCRGVAARAAEFAILTAARSGEVRGATWDEVDLEARLWTVPAERMKAGKEHRVPLSTAALTLLAAIPHRDNIMAKAHFVLQGRGGVGKTLVAVMLAQALASMGREPANIDTDPVNATFSGYAALKVQRLEIMEDDEINPRSFDRLVEMIDATRGDVVVDNGASSFVPLSHFLISNRVPSLLTEMGHQLVVHVVIAGAQSLLDTIHGFAQLARQFPPEAVFVVWLNPYYGPIEHEGKTFEQMKAYVANKDRVSAIVRLPSLKKETYGRDLAEMLQSRLTFDEALALGTLTIMTRQRLKIIRDQVFGQIASATVI